MQSERKILMRGVLRIVGLILREKHQLRRNKSDPIYALSPVGL